MDIRYLINKDGETFDLSELQSLSQQLDQLKEKDRRKYHYENAAEISTDDSKKILIVSGPGTGKSFLFLDRINHWFQNYPEGSLLVTSFVRKLVVDLQTKINNDNKLTREQKERTKVFTLHKFARSVVGKNHGTSKWTFKPYFKIIGQAWKEVIWTDVLACYPNLDKNVYSWKKFEKQLHNNYFDKEKDWKKVTQRYCELCRFYNAVGFADLITRAKIALKENPQLNEDNLFIIDEYQDFNCAEEALILQLVQNSKGLLIVGDDDQVLYEKLKSGKAALIRKLYKDTNMAKAMLPFCVRSSFHITKCGAYFIAQHDDSNRIEKIHLPLSTNQYAPKVQVIACATSATAVDYIEKFVADNKNEIDERKAKLLNEEEEDAFLLILTRAKEVDFYGRAKTKLKKIISDYKTEIRSFSEDYYKVLDYCLLAKNPRDNFIFRKILFYEGVNVKEVHSWIMQAMPNSKNFCDLDYEEVKKILEKCGNIRNLIDSEDSIDKIVDKLSGFIHINNKTFLKDDLKQQIINQAGITKLEQGEDEEAELEDVEIKKMCAIELMSIVGSKGLSADHVMIIGFDNVNMKYVTKNAFYVAMTRARKTLHIITALQSGGATEAHEFLELLPQDHIEFHSYKKGDRSTSPLNGKQGFLKYIKCLNSKSRTRKQN